MKSLKKGIITAMCFGTLLMTACGAEAEIEINPDRKLSYILIEAEEDSDMSLDWFETDTFSGYSREVDESTGQVHFSGERVKSKVKNFVETEDGMIEVKNISGFSSDTYKGYAYVIQDTFFGYKIYICDDIYNDELVLMCDEDEIKQLSYDELIKALKNEKYFMSLAEGE